MFALMDRFFVGLIGFEATGRNAGARELLFDELRDRTFVAASRGNGQKFEEQLLGCGVFRNVRLRFGCFQRNRFLANSRLAVKVNVFSPTGSGLRKVCTLSRYSLHHGQPQASLLANTDAREQRRIPILSEQVLLRVENLMGLSQGRSLESGSAFASPPLRTTA